MINLQSKCSESGEDMIKMKAVVATMRNLMIPTTQIGINLMADFNNKRMKTKP